MESSLNTQFFLPACCQYPPFFIDLNPTLQLHCWLIYCGLLNTSSRCQSDAPDYRPKSIAGNSGRRFSGLQQLVARQSATLCRCLLMREICADRSPRSHFQLGNRLRETTEPSPATHPATAGAHPTATPEHLQERANRDRGISHCSCDDVLLYHDGYGYEVLLNCFGAFCLKCYGCDTKVYVRLWFIQLNAYYSV